MKKVVITGGVGSGKSKVLEYLQNNCNCKIIRADDVAKELMEPEGKCYLDIINAFPEKVLVRNATEKNVQLTCPSFDRDKLSQLIFESDYNRRKVNSIVHPAVKEYILKDIDNEEMLGVYDYYFFEVALAIEEGYDKIFDETWFIYAPRSIRCERLKKYRGYTQDRIDDIMSSQLSEEEYRKHSTYTIKNDGNIADLYDNISHILHCD